MHDRHVTLGVILAMGTMSTAIVLVSFTPARSTRSFFGPLGRMAFANYLMQSLIFCGVFYSHGLGYFGKLGATDTLILGIVVYALQIVISMRWLECY